MLRATLLSVALALAVGTACAQPPTPITQAPFTALRTQVTTRAAGSESTAGVVARRSDGSTYLEMKNQDGSGMVLIADQARKRWVQLYLGKGYYTVGVDAVLPRTIDRPAGFAESYFKQQGDAGATYSSGTIATRVIGRRSMSGVETVGLAETVADGRTFERWYAPSLDLNVSISGDYPALASKVVTTYENLVVGEPDPKLFEVPAGYSQVTMDKGHIVEPDVVYKIGGEVKAPVVISSPEPEFSEQASKKKITGTVMVSLQVDESGVVSHVRVLRGVGYGLDEKALEAVRQYTFKPAMRNGQAVKVEMTVEINFMRF